MSKTRWLVLRDQPSSILAFEAIQVVVVAWQMLIAFDWSAVVGGAITLGLTYLISRRNMRAWRLTNWFLIFSLLVGLPFYLLAVHDHSNPAMWLGFMYLLVSLVLLLWPTSRSWFYGDNSAAQTAGE